MFPLQVVFKIVPLEGDLLVNGETQKRSEEILAEVAIALTLSRLRESTSESVSQVLRRCLVYDTGSAPVVSHTSNLPIFQEGS